MARQEGGGLDLDLPLQAGYCIVMRYAVVGLLVMFLACGDDTGPTEAGAVAGTGLASGTDGLGDGHGDGAAVDSGDGDADGASVVNGDAGPPDAGGNDTGGSGDGGADTGASISTDAGSCDLSRTRSFRNDQQPIVEGSFCDDIFTCLDGATDVTALLAAAPGFSCSNGEDPLGLCTSNQTVCQWITPGVLTNVQAARICAATVSGSASQELVCIVWE